MRRLWGIVSSSGREARHSHQNMTFTNLAQVQLRKNVATVPADAQGRQFFAFGTGAPQRAMTEQELISWANGNYLPTLRP